MKKTIIILEFDKNTPELGSTKGKLSCFDVRNNCHSLVHYPISFKGSGGTTLFDRGKNHCIMVGMYRHLKEPFRDRAYKATYKYASILNRNIWKDMAHANF